MKKDIVIFSLTDIFCKLKCYGQIVSQFLTHAQHICVLNLSLPQLHCQPTKIPISWYLQFAPNFFPRLSTGKALRFLTLCEISVVDVCPMAVSQTCTWRRRRKASTLCCYPGNRSFREPSLSTGHEEPQWQCANLSPAGIF